MRAGNDKNHLARRVERSADIYIPRMGNFNSVMPSGYLRSMRGSLPHELSAEPSIERSSS